MPAAIMAAMPMRPLPALLLTTVRPFGPLSMSAWISSHRRARPAEAADHHRGAVSDLGNRRGEIPHRLVHARPPGTVGRACPASWPCKTDRPAPHRQQAICAIFDICSIIARRRRVKQTDFVGGLAKGPARHGSLRLRPARHDHFPDVRGHGAGPRHRPALPAHACGAWLCPHGRQAFRTDAEGAAPWPRVSLRHPAAATAPAPS